MKNTAKKLLSVLLVLVTLMSLSIPAFAAENSFDNATSISFNRTYSGALHSSYENHFYKFDISSSSIVKFDYTANDMYISYIDIYDANGQKIWYYGKGYDSSTKKTAFTSEVGLTTGKYYLSISSSRSGKYNFSLSLTSANESFTESFNNKNDTINTAGSISFNKNYKGLLGVSDTKDFYKFKKSDNSMITLKYEANNLEFSYVEIYDINGEMVWESSNNHWNTTTHKANLETSINLASGTYYMLIRGNSDWGTYNFSIKTNGSTITPTPTPDPDDGDGSDTTNDFDIGAFFSTIWSFIVMIFNFIMSLFS